MDSIVVIVHIVLAVAIVGFVLIQQGKGADAGASFGGGASQTVFGGKGSGNFLSKTTGLLVAGFFVTSLTLAMFATKRSNEAQSIGIPSQQAIETQQSDAPVVEHVEGNASQGDAPQVD